MRSNIMNFYYEKAKIIEMIRANIRKRKLNTLFYPKFEADKKELQFLTDENKNNVLESIEQYEKIENQFKSWEKENKNSQTEKFPDIYIPPPKDDYMESLLLIDDQW